MDTLVSAAFCRRCRCRDACTPATASTSFSRCASATRSPACRGSSTSARKTGRTGPLVFVRVRHEISCDDRLAVTEEQDIVYRDNPGPDDPPPRVQHAPDDETWRREIHPDEVLLFRYSALTFNGYRLHYDRPFATGIQGYPGLVVHGPLIATLLADLVRRNLPEATVSSFSFRAIQRAVRHRPVLRLRPPGQRRANGDAVGARRRRGARGRSDGHVR